MRWSCCAGGESLWLWSHGHRDVCQLQVRAHCGFVVCCASSRSSDAFMCYGMCSSDGMRLVTSSMDKRLLLWDIESATRILSMSGHADDVYSCSFMPVRLSVWLSGCLVVWLSGCLVVWLSGCLAWRRIGYSHAHSKCCGCFVLCYGSQDGTRVISASNDKTVKIWDVGGVDAQRVSAPVKRAQYQRCESIRSCTVYVNYR